MESLDMDSRTERCYRQQNASVDYFTKFTSWIHSHPFSTVIPCRPALQPPLTMRTMTSSLWAPPAFELWFWRRLLRVPWAVRRSNQSVLKEISPECSLEGVTLKLKLQYFSRPLWQILTHCKRSWCWERLKAGGEGTTEDEMVGWHHQLNGHEFEQAPGVGDGQGSLVCCSPWGHKESDMTEGLNWTGVVAFLFLFLKTVSLRYDCYTINWTNIKYAVSYV